MSTIFRRFAVAMVSLAAMAGVSGAQDKKDRPDQAQQADVRAMVVAVDDLVSGKPAASSLPLKWSQVHFIKAQGDKTYVPFTLDVDPAAFTAPTPVALYLRVAEHGDTELGSTPPPPVDPKKKKKKKDDAPPTDLRHQFTFEDVSFFNLPVAGAGQAQRIQRAFAVPPGEYDVYVAVKEEAPAPAPAPVPPPATPSAAPGAVAEVAEAKMGVVKAELTVPNLQGADLTTSSVIVAQSVDVLQTPLPPDRQADNPYTFGPMKITPSTTGLFTKKDDLNVIFWIYGAQTDPATKKPDITVEFAFNRKTADGERYFNKTEPQEMNASTLPAQFDLAAGHQLPGSLQVPLASFPAGDYHLLITVTDKVSSKSITRDVNFKVAAETVQQ
jgi:hypothetical protein